MGAKSEKGHSKRGASEDAIMPDVKTKIDTEKIKPTDEAKTLSGDYQRRLGDLIDLTDKQKSRLKKWLKKHLRRWENEVAPLHQKLKEDYDLSEGILPLDYMPFEGSSDIHVPVTETYLDLYESIISRSILGADLIWYGETDIEELREHLSEIETMMNFFARNQWNIEDSLEDVIRVVPRDGNAFLQITWAEEYEPSEDVLLMTSEDDYLNEFPTPQSAGVEEKEWQAIRERIREEATEEIPIEVPVSFEKLKYFGNKGELVELIDYVSIPSNILDLDNTRLRAYGKRYKMRSETLRKKAADKVFYKEAVEELIQKRNKSHSAKSHTIARERIEGVARESRDDEFEFFELVVLGHLDGIKKDIKNEDEESEFFGERKFLLTYNLDFDVLPQLIKYPYRVDFYAPFTIDKRAGSGSGRSVPEKTRRLNEEVDIQHNQRIDARTITSVPSFKGKKSIKKQLDDQLDMHLWGPGKILWLDNPELFDQFRIQPVDLGESLREEDNDMKLLDLRLGAAGSLLSGQTAPGDPDAPGNKTALMIQQSNLRMEDPLREMRKGIEKTGEICLSHLYQFGPPIIEFQGEEVAPGGRQIRTLSIHKKYLRTGIRLRMRGITVIGNPEAELQKGLSIHTVLLQEPMFAQDPELRINSLRRILRDGRIKGREDLLPSLDKIRQRAVQNQADAIKLLEQEKLAKEEQAQKNRLAKARTDIGIANIAEQEAKRGLGFNGQ